MDQGGFFIADGQFHRFGQDGTGEDASPAHAFIQQGGENAAMDNAVIAAMRGERGELGFDPAIVERKSEIQSNRVGLAANKALGVTGQKNSVFCSERFFKHRV